MHLSVYMGSINKLMARRFYQPNIYRYSEFNLLMVIQVEAFLI